MGRQDQIINERMKKLNALKAAGINPYPNRFEVKHTAQELQDKYKSLKNNEARKDKLKLAGRLMSFRNFGKIAFGVLQDHSGKIQIQIQSDKTPEKTQKFIKDFVDTGDIIGIEGTPLRTERGELSVLINTATMLTKSLLPLPEKWHGLQDEEERYRKRYLDTTINKEVKTVFETRAKMLSIMRTFMDEKGFIEIETPLLQTVYGGALAEPFITHINAYDTDVFLSIAPELPLKKALVGGFNKVYEITKKFRNEGADRSHNPEHMTIEWYQSYADYNDGMDLVEELIKKLAKEVLGKQTITYQGHKIDLRKWKRITLADAIQEHLGEDVSKIRTDDDAKKIAEKYNINPEEITKSNIQDELMKLFREKLIQPTFLIDYPLESSPLAKPKESDPTKAEVFQPFIGGLEIARAYSELNDPKLQEEHFKEQEEEREKGTKETMPTDSDFVTALQQGMPPACGVGIGIERLVMLFTDNASIRDVILFPFMRPLHSKNKKGGEM
ncbi:lysine--tRNA ligase [Candidatus Pacearchaeota archaeon]|nr:lysine--tRNA ligase [Candidatus Pacearchaeota archaeon]